MDEETETYLLLLLSDGNLPTGSFVASSGLESYVSHGFLSSSSVTPLEDPTVNFVRDSLSTYARSALPFVSDAHQVVTRHAEDDSLFDLDKTLQRLGELDDLYEAMTLNHIAKRASRAQGVALLTLYSRGFSKPAFMKSLDSSHDSSKGREELMTALVERLKLLVRREDTPGHLPICWGFLTGALGLTLERSQFLHLFLHARSLLSASVRLNILGPYASQQVLLHAIKPLVHTEAARCKYLRTGILISERKAQGNEEPKFDEKLDGPAVTWPLGEILAARHDLQHSRIFNS